MSEEKGHCSNDNISFLRCDTVQGFDNVTFLMSIVL